MSLANIESEYKLIRSWNLTYSQKAWIIYPSKVKEILDIIKFTKKTGMSFSIRTGECSYDSKSISLGDKNMIISLKKFNKIIKINNRNKIVSVQAGTKISEVIYHLKKKKLTLYSIPGGENISIGGAISANVIGKDSSKLFGSFGDSIKYLKIISYSGKIREFTNNSKEFYKYVGSFGMFGIILEAKIKAKRIISNNLSLNTKILKNIKEVNDELKIKDEYKYIQIDPFFRKKNFALVFNANFTGKNKNIYKNINLRANFFEKFLFKISSYFINSLTWKLFYTFFFQINDGRERYIDIHNFHYGSKYKHMIPLICRKSLVDYEVLVKKNLCKEFSKIQKFIKNNNIMPIYIIIKKLFKSKKKSFYNFNNNGYSIAISFDLRNLSKLKKNNLNSLFKRKKLLLNLSKTDSEFIVKKKEICSNNNKIFMSLYKKKMINIK